MVVYGPCLTVCPSWCLKVFDMVFLFASSVDGFQFSDSVLLLNGV